MRGSLKGRLFAILVLATGLVWALATVWIYVSTRAEVEHVLDARLMEAARMVSSLVDSQDIDVAVASLDRPAPPVRTGASYERQLSCQIWSLTGSLIGKSDGAPETRLSDHRDGFSEREIDGETWRVFAVENQALGIQVLVGDNLDIRARLVRDVVKGLLLPMALVVPALGALIWFGVGRGMRPLDELAEGLRRRKADDLHPISADAAAAEIRPVATALNGLFERVRETRERERVFLAYAAHELRTPLAGLKTQAEISLRTDREDVRQAALAQIVTAVDRTSRLVRQLLATAEAEAVGAASGDDLVDLARFLRSMAAEHSAQAELRGIRLELLPPAAAVVVRASEPLLALALRNIVENAINHSPPGAVVTVSWSAEAIVVEDQGPGMPENEIARATERFFRGSARSPVGSGLGLSIAALCAERIGGTLLLENRQPHGLRVALRLV
ncbi:ATP-binding protein [Aurantimonas sp. HBX-1]|uniref:ATP-binding protein n=1 Tax=Aurantimonas sp. HBX-1 TaxID=2906072 RepID=UPI001F2DCDCC|nr:ATP-binding protein [Aurantimonas sp. HBX-1]UIJ71354.1 sensor histidine kinase N-terminal domain-containing protein [Aurantimonas sp. HBX-1]